MLEGGEVRCVREVRWIVTSSKGKEPDSSDSKKKKKNYYSYVLTCSVDSLGFFSFLFFFSCSFSC